MHDPTVKVFVVKTFLEYGYVQIFPQNNFFFEDQMFLCNTELTLINSNKNFPDHEIDQMIYASIVFM